MLYGTTLFGQRSYKAVKFPNGQVGGLITVALNILCCGTRLLSGMTIQYSFIKIIMRWHGYGFNCI